MKKTTLAGGTSPFAHLLGGAAALAGRALGRKADDDRDDANADDDGDDDTTADDGDDHDDTTADDQPTDDPEKGKKGRKGKKAETDDDDDDDADAEDEDIEEPEDEKEAKGFRAGRLAERKRCAAIFSSPAAAGRPDLAATLAFSTRQSSAEAIAVLTTATAGGTQPRGRSTLDDRMAGRREARPGTGTGAQGKTASFADQMSAALKKAGR
ncbi:hypothetical protein [Sphingomonas sp. Leaf25]|uniref:hypothetical protein n=1 Tax=Sphingomonas sp. Leaf25 TaxID=1735692 RepID=UPI0006F2722C|nr:hypothetical protein [Sphingomonas sp. Leaf25]KQN00562.1 hypothetical protein ASE78_05615 [Sphingomonas sp. Leaf25]